MDERKDTFNYTYSAKQQEEIKKIRDKYLSKEENKMEQLRRLDASASRPGAIASVTLGTVSTLLLGVGMSCTMVWGDAWFIPGIIVGLLGMAGIVAAYPVYIHITRKQRKKLAPEILRLTDELTQEQS